MIDVFDVLLGIAVLLGAAAALYGSRRIVGVMSFLVLGLLLTVLWARLGAPDIAIAEAAIASGVTGAFLLAAATGHPETSYEEGNVGRRTLTVLEAAVGVSAVVLVGVAAVSAARIAPSDPLEVQASASVADAVVGHPITAVLLDFRAYDTLLEIAVLAAAVIAALALLCDSGMKRVVWVTETRPVVLGFVKLIAPVVVMLAGWLLVAGSTQPGGAFQAGAMLTGVLLLLYLSGRARTMVTGKWLVPGALIGLAVFVAAGVGTFAAGRAWLDVADGWGGVVVLLIEAALAVSIGVGLAALFIAGNPERA
ncbi:MnhB domain-containing protein [Hoyosella altamirensis]|uniref:Multisubunit Na+/H+ antiporter MnhB subunit n=1 Tax=Hoyosella altamirensis TaxID=616997 RepID=A0A839RNS3_9ACTN|nr:MnhB domain-containing protein [Hoyosella altamirensis]MBB3038642.1 multisubunit Na+/H+ antiporter MnhB subunit [Hoyosella altamirensis]